MIKTCCKELELNERYGTIHETDNGIFYNGLGKVYYCPYCGTELKCMSKEEVLNYKLGREHQRYTQNLETIFNEYKGK